jgi:hypothetical protein
MHIRRDCPSARAKGGGDAGLHRCSAGRVRETKLCIRNGRIHDSARKMVQPCGLSLQQRQVAVRRGSVAIECGDSEGPVIRILPGNAKTMRNLRRPP